MARAIHIDGVGEEPLLLIGEAGRGRSAGIACDSCLLIHEQTMNMIVCKKSAGHERVSTRRVTTVRERVRDRALGRSRHNLLSVICYLKPAFIEKLSAGFGPESLETEQFTYFSLLKL